MINVNPTNSAPAQVARSIAERIAILQLDLSDLHVMTEAATGAYAVTPVIAAAAGATVTAIAKSTRYGTSDDACRQVRQLASELGVDQRINVVSHLTADLIGQAHIVTNSGHVRPLDARFVRSMKRGAAIPFMYESWELRPGEVDLDACRDCGVLVAGTNESHTHVRVFDYLGMLALFGLFQCGVPVRFSRILLICDNRFAPYLSKTLIDCGAELEVWPELPTGVSIPARPQSTKGRHTRDAVVVAATPVSHPIIGKRGNSQYAVDDIGSFGAMVQLWGDVDRDCLDGITCYPRVPPRLGHMGVLLSELGPEPIVRLQAAGLKVGEILVRQPTSLDEYSGLCQRVKV